MKLILQILLILLVVSTISICAIKPDMHKTVIVYDSAYTFEPKKQVEVETKEIPVMEKVVTPQKTTKVVQNNVVQEETKIQTPKTISVKQQTAPKTTTQTKTETKVQPKSVVSQNKQIKAIEKPIVKVVTKKTEQPKILTQQEETIAWNIWRSNLQNKIMQDTKLPIMPAGIVFKFSFTVDKYGKVSNVQTWSETPSYTPYAIQYIAPVIRSYQGRAILNFPSGTQRTVTNVTGGWRISVNEKFSTPQDYNDVEKVIR